MITRYGLAAVTAAIVSTGTDTRGVRAVFETTDFAGTTKDSTVTSTIVREPGVLVEVAGLKRWTVPMIQDSLNAYVPGTSLFRKDCKDAIQREFTIFPQSVIIQNAADSAVTIFLAVIEPGDKKLITVRTFTGDPKRSSAPWTGLSELTRTRFTSVRNAMLLNVEARAAGLTPVLTKALRADSVEFTRVWDLLATQRTPKDLAAARQVLATSPNAYDRLAAIVILSGFDHDDAAWHALIGALLDPKDTVREYARAVLQSFGRNFTRTVDWGPAAPDVHAVLQGSDLWSLTETLDLLVATGVQPELAVPLLRGGGNGVLMFAGAQNSWARGPAYRFLHAISGKDLGGNPEQWRKWIASL